MKNLEELNPLPQVSAKEDESAGLRARNKRSMAG
jgi:hypothetical protein